MKLHYLALTFIAVSAQADVYKLKFSTYSAEANPVADCVEKPVIRAIESNSKGRIKVESHFAGSPLSTPSRQYDQIAKGITDISVTFSTFSPGPMAAMNITVPPFTIENDAKAVKALYTMRGDIEATWNDNVKLGTAMFAGNGIYGIREKNAITDFTALRNYKFLTSTVGILSAKQLGISAKNVPLQAWYENLSKGVYDGWGGVASQILSFKLGEVSQSYYYVPNMMRPTGAILINKKFYNSLPDDLKQVVDEATGPATGERMTQCYLKIDQMARAVVQKRQQLWTDASQEDIDEMKVLTAPVKDIWLAVLKNVFKIPAQALYDKFIKLQAEA